MLLVYSVEIKRRGLEVSICIFLTIFYKKSSLLMGLKCRPYLCHHLLTQVPSICHVFHVALDFVFL